MSKKNDWSSRKQDRVEKQSANDQKKHGIDRNQALCTECGEWYNADSRSDVNRHAH